MYKSTLLIASVACSAILNLAARPVTIGPPLICHPFDIGDARTIAWSGEQKCTSPSDKARLVADVASVLKTEQDVLVRMETLRRAALATGRDRALAWELLGRSGLMVLEQQSARSADGLAWFDTGFLLATYDQLGFDLGFNAGVSDGMRGYGYVRKAIDLLRAQDPKGGATMEFAAALISHPCMLRENRTPASEARREALYAEHVQRASSGATDKSLLAKNLHTHLANWGGPKRKDT